MAPAPQPGEITQLLVAWGDGDRASGDRLIPLVYSQLKSIAVSYVRHGRGDRTLQRTALVHEAFLRLVDQRVPWQNRSQFYGLAAQMMRRIAIDDARRRGRVKRGAAAEKIPIELAGEIAGAADLEPVDAILLDRALTALESLDPKAARIVELRFFGGLTIEETADVQGQSVSAIKREWAAARAWLFRAMTSESLPSRSAGE
ncbi:MAG TPA: ECF-type sigma factor [Vicinamibacterales bacterium]|nr:ECF-type sigma factor [Vicinamibacterales bacterium]